MGYNTSQLSLKSRNTHRDKVLLHKRGEHVVSDSGHNVTEVQGRDDTILVFVLLGKCLACMLQLQLLKKDIARRCVNNVNIVKVTQYVKKGKQGNESIKGTQLTCRNWVNSR